MILVSTSTVEITPKEQYLPCYVSGNPLRDEKTDKVHDRFEWTVIVLKINNKLMVWGEIDIIEIDFKLADIMFCGIISDCFRNICHSHSCIRQEILGPFDSNGTDHFCIGHSHQIFN